MQGGLLNSMENREQVLLIQRTDKLNKFASSTPVFILVACLLAIIVTVVSFIRVNSDFDKRIILQKELEEKDAEISKRLQLIQSIAEKISLGDYKIRVSDESKDVLGSLSGSLNKMAESLDHRLKILKKMNGCKMVLLG